MTAKRITEIPRIPERKVDAHKGEVGRIMVVGGTLGERAMIGAPALVANAALRSGAGLVQIAAQRDAMPFALMMAPCATARSLESDDPDLTRLAVEFGADVVAVGPGLGDCVSADSIRKLLESFSGGLVVDADALNLLSSLGRWTAAWPHNVVLTPHPGEMRRLVDGFGLKLDVNDRVNCATQFAKETGVTVLLKGAGTVVSDAARVYVNQTGNAGMATAGAGDVLTGIIAALMGQGLGAFDAAVLGAYVHGLAGDSAAEEMGRISLTATDLIDFLPEAFSDLSLEVPTWGESS